MSTIKTVLSEEKERLENLKKRYEKEIKKLPAGSLTIKLRKNKKYAYLAYRQKGKVKTDYIGQADLKEVAEINSKIQKRKKLEGLLKATKERLKEVERVLHGKKI